MGRPIAGGVSFTLVTDPANATQSEYRLTIYSNAGRTVQVGDPVTAQSSGGSVQERIILAVTGLTADTRYYPKLEYRAEVSVGDWTEVAAVTSDMSFYALPAASGTLKLAFIFDPHRDMTAMETPEYETTVRHQNAMDVVAAEKFHLAILGGDENVTPAAQFTVQADADAWGVLFRANTETITDKMPLAHILGNHEKRDGSGTGLDAIMASMMLDFLMNPAADDAGEKFWKITAGPALLLGIEPYTESGFPAIADSPTVWDISAAQKTMIADALAATECPFVFLIVHQLLGGGNGYGMGGGTKICAPGTYMLTLQGVLIAARAANPAIKQIIVVHGHDHMHEHAVVDAIHHVEVAATSGTFPARYTNALGYLNAAGGPAENVGYSDDYAMGFLRATVAPTLCTLDFMRTTASDGSTPANAVLYSVQIPAVPNTGSLRSATLRRGRAA